MYVCMYVCMSVCMYVHAYMHIYTHASMNAGRQADARTGIPTHANIHTYMHACIHSTVRIDKTQMTCNRNICKYICGLQSLWRRSMLTVRPWRPSGITPLRAPPDRPSQDVLRSSRRRITPKSSILPLQLSIGLSVCLSMSSLTN